MNLFYLIIIPVVVGGMALLGVMDASRAGLNRYRARKEAEPVETGVETAREGTDVAGDMGPHQDNEEAGDG